MKNILISIGMSPNQSHFAIKGNLQTYLDISAVTGTSFHAVEIQDIGWDLVLNVVTPEAALLESGSFKRIHLREKSGKKLRSATVPISVIPTIKAAVEGVNGLTVDGILCGAVSQGLRRRAR